MFAVIFEVEINEDRKDEYLKIASILKEQLVNQKGFISGERFQSLINEKKLLSLSYWEDEEAILSWKKNIDHMSAQKYVLRYLQIFHLQNRSLKVFVHYHLK